MRHGAETSGPREPCRLIGRGKALCVVTSHSVLESLILQPCYREHLKGEGLKSDHAAGIRGPRCRREGRMDGVCTASTWPGCYQPAPRKRAATVSTASAP